MRQFRRLLSKASSTAHLEMGTVLDRYQPVHGFLNGWSNFSVSTLAVVQLRNTAGFTVPAFRDEARQIYGDVGSALARADMSALRKLTTPSCFASLSDSLRQRPKGQRHTWDVVDVAAAVRQVRIGHHKSAPERRFAQVTCSIDAKLVWTIRDGRGRVIGGLGNADAPHVANDFWVFEKCISQPVEPPAWRLKERLVVEQAASSEG
jgi:predicted lipid-binding transport protein (Tim44 family)